MRRLAKSSAYAAPIAQVNRIGSPTDPDATRRAGSLHPSASDVGTDRTM